MKFVTVFLVLLALTATTFAAPLTPGQYEALFTRFVQQYGKSYNGLTLITKYNTFVDNLNKIMEHNMSGSSYTLAMNEFGDLTQAEFAEKFTGVKTMPKINRTKDNKYTPKSNVKASSLDWREKGAVNPVKNQGQCGSCWAFSAVTALESRVAISGKSLYDLSEQQLVDCSGAYGNMGCNGGLMEYAYTYYKEKGGACLTSEYPYTARDGNCKSCTPVVPVTGYEWVDLHNEDALMTAVNEGPVSIAVSAGNVAFQFYSGGVLDNKACGTNLDHGVAIVGYGTENGKDYWTIRNSWGATWGEKGYIRVVRGKNMCGVTEYPIVPTF